MTEQEKQIFNETYKEHAAYMKEILEAANKISKQITKELDSCVDFIIKKTTEVNTLEVDFAMMEVLVLRIPALCYYLQGKINDFGLQSEIDELITNEKVVEKIQELKGEKGDAREKMKRAEAFFTNDRIIEVLNKQIYINLKETIARADKVYEGLKKIMDARTRENEYNRKSQTFAT